MCRISDSIHLDLDLYLYTSTLKSTCIYRFALFGGRKLYRITVTDTDIFIKHLFDFPSRPFCFSDFKSLSRKVQWEVNILKNFIGSRNRATKGGSTFKMKKKKLKKKITQEINMCFQSECFTNMVQLLSDLTGLTRTPTISALITTIQVSMSESFLYYTIIILVRNLSL